MQSFSPKPVNFDEITLIKVWRGVMTRKKMRPIMEQWRREKMEAERKREEAQRIKDQAEMDPDELERVKKEEELLKYLEASEGVRQNDVTNMASQRKRGPIRKTEFPMELKYLLSTRLVKLMGPATGPAGYIPVELELP